MGNPMPPRPINPTFIGPPPPFPCVASSVSYISSVGAAILPPHQQRDDGVHHGDQEQREREVQAHAVHGIPDAAQQKRERGPRWPWPVPLQRDRQEKLKHG